MFVTRSKQPWIIIQDAVAASAEYYERVLIWSKESLDRKHVLLSIIKQCRAANKT